MLGIANKTNKTYLSITIRYQKMAIHNQWTNANGSVWPINVNNLLKYISAIHKSVSPSTLYSYLSALADKHASLGLYWDDVRYDPAVIRTLKLIKRNYIHRPTKKSEMITREHLIIISKYKFHDAFETLLFQAIAFSAFYGLA